MFSTPRLSPCDGCVPTDRIERCSQNCFSVGPGRHYCVLVRAGFFDSLLPECHSGLNSLGSILSSWDYCFDTLIRNCVNSCPTFGGRRMVKAWLKSDRMRQEDRNFTIRGIYCLVAG